MNRLTDQQLLREYAGPRWEAAFAELVRRHVDFVHSAALRMVRDAHLAEDVTQSVFAALAQNARQLSEHPVLSGWLHRTAQNLAANVVRSEVRRRAREQEAVAMNELLAAEPAARWEDIAPQLDAALSELSEADRDALLLRYFERKSAPEMAELLGISTEAAQKRVTRAVERLRELFSQRNVTIGASGLVAVITANAVQAAPVGLALTICTATLAGTAVSTSTVIAATKTIAMTTLQKTLVTAALTVVAGAGIFEAHQAAQLREQNQKLQQQQAPLAEQIQQLQRERDDATNRLAGMAEEIAKNQKNNLELLKLRGEVAQLKNSETQNKNTDPIEASATAWAEKANRLKQWQEQTPRQTIPELKLLSDWDWLNGVQGIPNWAETTNNYAFFSGMLRTTAKSRFANIMAFALGDYLVASKGQLPDDLSELKPYLNTYLNRNNPNRLTSDAVSEVPDDILQRYELLHTGNVNALSQSEPLVAEKLPIQNAQYDALFKVGAFGYSYTGVSPTGSSGGMPIGSRYADGRLEKLFKSK